MTKNRLEAFTDGVIAIIITVMVLELKVPHEVGLRALQQTWPEFSAYILSFVMLGIYWNNHHHMFQAVRHVSGSVLWANLHLLFWLSLIPFCMEWIRDSGFVGMPVGFVALVFFMCAIAYTILVQALRRVHGRSSEFARALGADTKGYISLAIYALALALFWFAPYVSCALFVLVAILWFVPDPRFAKVKNAD